MERNRDLFWKLLEPEHPRAEAFCRRLANNREDGDDLYQDALIVGLTKFSKLREESSFRPWLYRIIINTFKNSLRQPWYNRFLPLNAESLERADTMNPVSVHCTRKWLEIAFGALAPEARGLITLFELEGWSIAELARMNHCPEGTIKARLSRARTRMREAIKKHRGPISSLAGGAKLVNGQREARKVAFNSILSEVDIWVAAKSNAK